MRPVTAPSPRATSQTASNPIAGFLAGLGSVFNNQTPVLNPAQTGQTETGVVTGELNAADPDSPRLSFVVSRQPTHGTVSIDPHGRYTYTAAPILAQTGTVDSFAVTVSDAPSGFAIHGLAGLLHLLSFGLIGQRGDSSTRIVPVTVIPFMTGNRPPTAMVRIEDPDPDTGVVTGMILGSDPDGDPLTYQGPASTAKGSVVIESTGAFTYTPTGSARQAAADDSATSTDKSDTFTVTVTDTYGAMEDIPVTVPVSPVALPAGRDHVLITRSDLMSKPTTGPGWEFLLSQADSDWETPNLSADNTKTPARVLGAALVYARTGDPFYRDKVIAAVKSVPGTEAAATIVLPFARNMFGYVVAADLVDMPLDTVADNGETWGEFLHRAGVEEFSGNGRWISLEKTAGESASNWNAYALSSHLAISLVLGDEAAVLRDIDIYRRFLGDMTSPAPPFNPTSGYRWNNLGSTWDMTPTMQVGINPYSPVDQRNGAIILDASRSAVFPSNICCQMDIAGRGYTEESLDGLVAIATVLQARGLDFTDFENKSLLRAYQFLVTHGGPSGYSNGRYLALATNAWYGTSFDTSPGDSVARHLGYGGWLF